jgi:hypothetical protein
MDTDRSPGVGPLTWATLRLLAFSWLILGVLMVWNLIRFPPRGAADLLDDGGVWLFVTGPHLMLGAAAWRSRGRSEVIAPALVGAILYAVMASVVGALAVLDAPPGRAMNRFARIALCMYSLGWPLGVVVLTVAFARTPPPLPPDTDDD